MKRLLRADPQQIQSGIYLGLNKSVVPLWEDGLNLAFRGFGVERINGASLATTFAAAGVPYDVEQAAVNGNPRVFIGTSLGISMAERIGTSWSSTIIGAWPTPSQYADLETWGTWIVGTNGQDPPQVWKNTGALAALGGTNFAGDGFTTAKVLKRKSPFLLAFNTNLGEDRVHWSTDSDIEIWEPSLSNAAGFLNLRDLDSAIISVEDIGEQLAVYSRNSMFLGNYIGGGNWGFRRALGGIGAVSRRSVVRVDPLNYGLNENGIWQTDGNSFQYLDDPAVSKWLLDRVDWGLRSTIWGYHDSRLKRCMWNFPVLGALGGGRASIYYHYEGRLFSRGDIVVSVADPQEVLEYPVVVAEDGKLGLWQAAPTHFGADITFYLKSKPIDFGSNDMFKTLEMMLFEGVWDATTGLVISTLQHPEDPSPEVVHSAPLERKNYLKDGGREAPYFRFEINGTKAVSINVIECWGNAAGLAV